MSDGWELAESQSIKETGNLKCFGLLIWTKLQAWNTDVFNFETCNWIFLWSRTSWASSWPLWLSICQGDQGVKTTHSTWVTRRHNHKEGHSTPKDRTFKKNAGRYKIKVHGWCDDMGGCYHCITWPWFPSLTPQQCYWWQYRDALFILAHWAARIGNEGGVSALLLPTGMATMGGEVDTARHFAKLSPRLLL